MLAFYFSRVGGKRRGHSRIDPPRLGDDLKDDVCAATAAKIEEPKGRETKRRQQDGGRSEQPQLPPYR